MRRIVGVGLPLLVVLGGVVAFFLWRAEVADLRETWEARLAAYHAAGELSLNEALALPVAPDDENAAPLLAQVKEAYAAAFPDYPGPVDILLEVDPEEGEGLTDEMRAELGAAWPRLLPLYERLAEATRRPVLEFRWDPSDEDTPIVEVQHAGEMWTLLELYRPDSALAATRQQLALAVAWRPHALIDVLVRWGYATHAVHRLRRVLAGAADVDAEDRATLDALLGRLEGSQLDDWRTGLRDQRRWIARYVAWATGEVPRPAGYEHDEDIARDGRWMARADLYPRALAALDRVDATLEAAASWETLRAAPPPPPDEDLAHRGAFLVMPLVLQAKPFSTLAVLRLARWALVLDRLRREGGALPTDPLAYGPFFPGGLPLDPYTGRPFPLTLADGVLTIEADLHATPPHLRPEVAREDLEAEGLRWSFPVGR